MSNNYEDLKYNYALFKDTILEGINQGEAYKLDRIYDEFIMKGAIPSEHAVSKKLVGVLLIQISLDELLEEYEDSHFEITYKITKKGRAFRFSDSYVKKLFREDIEERRISVHHANLLLENSVLRYKYWILLISIVATAGITGYITDQINKRQNERMQELIPQQQPIIINAPDTIVSKVIILDTNPVDTSSIFRRKEPKVNQIENVIASD